MYLKDLLNYISLPNNCQPYIINPQNKSYGKTLAVKGDGEEGPESLLRFLALLRKGWRTTSREKHYFITKGQKKIFEQLLYRFNFVNLLNLEFFGLPYLHSPNNKLLVTRPSSLRDYRFYTPGSPNLPC